MTAHELPPNTDILIVLQRMEGDRKADLLRIEGVAHGIGDAVQRLTEETRTSLTELKQEVGLVKAQATATNGRVTTLEKLGQYAAGAKAASSKWVAWVGGIIGGGTLAVLGLFLTKLAGS